MTAANEIKAVVEMFKCVAQGSDGCETNPFFTPYPYLQAPQPTPFGLF